MLTNGAAHTENRRCALTSHTLSAACEPALAYVVAPTSGDYLCSLLPTASYFYLRHLYSHVLLLGLRLCYWTLSGAMFRTQGLYGLSLIDL